MSVAKHSQPFMTYFSGFVTLEDLFVLDADNVQAHLNSLQWPTVYDQNTFTSFYKETRAIFLLIVGIDTFLAQPLLVPCFESRSHLLALRFILVDEHQTRLTFLSNNYESD